MAGSKRSVRHQRAKAIRKDDYPEGSPRKTKRKKRGLPELARAHCSLYHQLKEEGILVPDADLLIAATAMSHHIALKTKDEHFERLRHLGLRLEQEPKEQRE